MNISSISRRSSFIAPIPLSASGKAAVSARSIRHLYTTPNTSGPSSIRGSNTIRRQTSAALATSTTSEDSIPPLPHRPRYDPPPPPSSSSTADDQLLKEHFDTPGSAAFSALFSASTGLFGLHPLVNPRALEPLTQRTLIHAQQLVDRIRNAKSVSDPSGREIRLVVKNLDRLSDLLCGVIDMCELVRNVHPDKKWVAASERSYERLCSFMNGLNTDQGLYEALVATLDHPHTDPLSTAETQVALTFLRDFEKSGIHLPPSVRARFVEISDSLLTLGRTFLSYAALGPTPKPPIEIPDAERLLTGMGSQFVDSLPRRGDTAYVVPGSWEAQMIQRYAREGEARRLVYVGNNKKEPERVDVLETMLKERAELAGVLNKGNWSEVVLTDKMAKNPENVMGFLNSLAKHHKTYASQDVAILKKLKATSLTGNFYSTDKGSVAHLPTFNAWDRDFYSEKYLQSLSPSTAATQPISPYFSTGNCLLGLSKLFTKLYGISFRPANLSPGEVWHKDVRKLEVVDENEGVIGVIYCDLFSRNGKPPSAAHYTVRCSRRVDDDDLEGDHLPRGWSEGLGDGLEDEGVRIKGREGKYQLPIVVLTTDFGNVTSGRPALLGWNDVETLFHEMGHAIHSMIGRTEYHNVSGTRCATDFVELPSILMEHFVSSPSVLSLFAKHYQTGATIPLPLIQSHLSIQQSLSSLETHGQILMAILDQKYHSISPTSATSIESDFSTQMYNELQSEIGVIPPVEGTAWQTQFGHLYGYGSTYYSYLFDRAISGKIWNELFVNDPLDRAGGEVFKEGVLKWGGGKDPWQLIGSVLKDPREAEIVSRGDEKSMDMVGSWLLK